MLPAPLRALLDEPRPVQAPAPMRQDWALVAVVMAWTALEAFVRDGLAWLPLVVAVSVVIALTLPWRRTHPLPAVVVGFGTLLASDLLRTVSLDGRGLTSIAVVLLLPYALFRWGSGREAALGLGLILVWLPVTHVADPAPAGEVVAGVTFFLLSAVLGAAMRFQGNARARAIEQGKLLERSALARELHDAVGHHVSAIAVQAQAGRALAASQPDRALSVLATIEEAAARALAEMRAMVGVLRDGAEPELAPRSGVADIGRLARSGENAPRVHVLLRGDLDGLSPAVDVALYRIAQESITNALRHARHATKVDVTVEGDGPQVRLTVRDDGLPVGANRAAAPGYGLVGMTERAALLGGSLSAGPSGAGGWRVEAVLPRAGALT